MKKRKLLIVDDEPDITKLLKKRFEFEGFECFTAQNGKEALSIAKDKKPSLIILDLSLPEKDGLAINKELKAHSETKDIPVIVYTAQNPDLVAKKGIEALEIVDFVLKPFDSKALVFLVEESLRKIEKKK